MRSLYCSGSERMKVSSLLMKENEEEQEKGKGLTWLRENEGQFSTEPEKKRGRAMYKYVKGQVSICDTLRTPKEEGGLQSPLL